MDTRSSFASMPSPGLDHVSWKRVSRNDRLHCRTFRMAAARVFLLAELAEGAPARRKKGVRQSVSRVSPDEPPAAILSMIVHRRRSHGTHHPQRHLCRTEDRPTRRTREAARRHSRAEKVPEPGQGAQTASAVAVGEGLTR